jgi:hypothetical protein
METLSGQWKMTVSGLWQKLAYVYEVSLADLVAHLKEHTSDGDAPRIGVDVRVGYVQHVSRSSNYLSQGTRYVLLSFYDAARAYWGWYGARQCCGLFSHFCVGISDLWETRC